MLSLYIMVASFGARAAFLSAYNWRTVPKHQLFYTYLIVLCNISLYRDQYIIIMLCRTRELEAMSEESKKQYIDAAKITPESVDMPTDGWGEAHRILQNMQKNVSDV